MNKEKETKQKIEKSKTLKDNKKIQYEIPKLVDFESVGIASGNACPFGVNECRPGSFLDG